MKSTLHCPTPEKPSFRRHLALERRVLDGATFTPAKPAHRWIEVDWPGCVVVPGLTLEWRIVMPCEALDPASASEPAEDGVTWLPPPSPDQIVEVTIFAETADQPGSLDHITGWPGSTALGTRLLAEGRLCDGRRVLAVYRHDRRDEATFRRLATQAASVSLPADFGPPEDLRVLMHGREPDGSMVFVDLALSQVIGVPKNT